MVGFAGRVHPAMDTLTRKPLLLFQLSGLFLLRTAHRAFLFGLFQEPPHKDRGIYDPAARGQVSVRPYLITT